MQDDTNAEFPALQEQLAKDVEFDLFAQCRHERAAAPQLVVEPLMVDSIASVLPFPGPPTRRTIRGVWFG